MGTETVSAEDQIRAALQAGGTLRGVAKECEAGIGVVRRVLGEMRREGFVGRETPGKADPAEVLRSVLARMLAELDAPAPAPDPKPEVLEQPPTKFAAEPRTRVVDLGKRYERIAVISDLHHPFQDDVAIDCALAVVRDFRPQMLVILGDYFDCYSISSHDQEPGRAPHLQDEFDAARETHRKIEDAVNGADVVWVDGNHEERINRMQREKPGFFKLRSLELPIAAELPRRWMYYRDQTRLLVGPLSLIHGDIKGRGTRSVHVAKGMLDTLGRTCMFAHLHKFQDHYHTEADGDVRAAFGNGHLCDVSQAKYITNPNWQSGLSTLEFDWSAGIFSRFPHLIVRGRHRWGGRTYGACAPIGA